jgi:hypothetical protein
MRPGTPLDESHGRFASSLSDLSTKQEQNISRPDFKSLSGHIPRSSLRSSDLLPFYHQYPAACCGDFLLET